MKQPCLDCGTPSDGTRCQTHSVRHERQRNRTSQAIRKSRGTSAYDTGNYRGQSKGVRATARVCHICGQGPKAGDPFQADHVIPILVGGGSGPLAAAHRSCNIGRSNKLRAGKPDPATHNKHRRGGGPPQPNTPKKQNNTTDHSPYKT